jgi:hypothetical protein
MREGRFFMPEQLDECVQKVMADGKDKSAAIAICRASLDMANVTDDERIAVGNLLSSLPEDAWAAARETYAVARERLGASHEQALSKLAGLPGYLGWEHIENVGWTRSFQAPHTRTVVGVEIFAEGRWTDSAGNTRTWTADDLRSMADAAQANVPERVPLKAGHTSDQFNARLASALEVPEGIVTGEMGQGQIALGRVTNLRVQGGKLLADFADVPVPIADMVEMHGAAGFTNVSSEIVGEIVTGDGRKFGPALVGVALLGAEDPAVESLNGLEAALVMSAPGKAVYRFSRENGLTQIKEPKQSVWQAFMQQMKAFFEHEYRTGSEEDDMDVKEIREALGLAEDADVLEHVKELKAKADAPSPDPKDGEGKDGDFSKADFAALKAEVTEIKAENVALKHEQRVSTFTARAQAWKEAGAVDDADAIGKELADLTDEQAEKVAASYEKAAASLKKASIFTAVSTPRTAESQSGDEDFEASVKKHMDAGMTREKAMAQVARESPAMFRKYQAEHLVSVRRNGLSVEE